MVWLARRGGSWALIRQVIVLTGIIACQVMLMHSRVAACTGDCRDDGGVTIDEILIMVNLALGGTGTCPAADADGNSMVTIDEILQGVNHALLGCPSSATPSATATPTLQQTATSTPTPATSPIASATIQAPLFKHSRTQLLGHSSDAILATGDVNADGLRDVVMVSNDGAGAVGIAYPGGRFIAQPSFTAGDRPSDARLAEINGDDALDLIVANAGFVHLSVFPGHGNGAFGTSQFLVVGMTPSAIAINDLNNDRLSDIVVANRGSNDVSVLLGMGRGRFATHRDYRVGDGPIGLVVTDVTRDGVLDVVTANHDSSDISIRPGLGDGTFADPIPLLTVEPPVAMAAGRFNDDSTIDLATVNERSGDVSLFFAEPSGGFTGRRAGPLVESGPYTRGSRQLLAVDLTNDHREDLVTVREEVVRVLHAQRDGSMIVAQELNLSPLREVAFIDAPLSATIDEMTGDEIPDLVLEGGGTLWVLRGNAAGTFETEPRVPVTGPLVAVASAQVNDDTPLDLIVGHPDGTFGVLLGMESGSFAEERTFQTGGSICGLTVADVNGDLHVDVVTTDGDAGDVVVRKGKGDATFELPDRIHFGGIPCRMAAADFDGDGRDDIVLIDRGTLASAIFSTPGDGFSAPVPVARVLGRDLQVVDADMDGGRDVLFLGGLVRSLGNRMFDSGQRLPIAVAFAGAIAAADLNADHRLDFIIGKTGSTPPPDSAFVPRLVIAYGAEGDFVVPPPLSIGRGPIRVVPVDMNGDDILDVVTGNAASGDVSILLGIGDGTFRPEQRYGAGAGFIDLLIADFNRDGVLDIITGSPEGYLTILAGHN